MRVSIYLPVLAAIHDCLRSGRSNYNRDSMCKQFLSRDRFDMQCSDGAVFGQDAAMGGIDTNPSLD